ncbi:DNA cytosine methyltransferase [Mycobacteroides abscessus]|uniref:DNA cytosine methyltransferase n=1 Tax=Mycobacteroides abscessus TaxID=36809 RepID=UPI00266C61F0|nr:DNA cytosine methyltransferase [Mycobacteroides abscessus]MDO3216145.1 DNA cytosine methyltransferase [Mycobacteroides abscessus subsp. abscessus]
MSARVKQPPETSARRRVPVCEIFAGVGSVASGFERGGPFKVAYLNDIDPLAARTFASNAIDSTTYDVRDIRDVTGPRILGEAGIGSTFGLLGCPPCQGWSAAGQRRTDDERNRLLLEYFRLVRSLRPVFFVMENVPSVADRSELHNELTQIGAGYRIWSGVLNAAAYGLPQTRQRTIVIGYRRDTDIAPTCPLPTHGGTRKVWDYRSEKAVTPTLQSLDAILGAAPRMVRAAAGMGVHYGDTLVELSPFVTVGDAIGDLSGGRRTTRSDYAQALALPRAEQPANHVPWNHSDDLVARMRLVPEGSRPPLEATNGRTYYSQAYTRLHRKGLARTVTTNFHNPGCGRFLHYKLNRTITVREAARLQGFSDDFVFTGHQSHQARIVGNAFPPIWAEAIARHIAKELAPVLPGM